MSYFRRRARERELARAQREWRRELEEDLRRLETAPGHAEVEPLEPDSRRYYPLRDGLAAEGPRTRHRGTLNNRSRTYLAALATLLVTLVVLLFDNGSGGYTFRRVLGIDDRVIEAVLPGGDGEYAFFDTLPGSDKPVTWSPCKPIRYVVNSDQAPTDWADLITDSAEKVSQASGLALTYEGTTTERELSDAVKPNEVLITWATAEQDSRLSGDVAGLGGPVSITLSGRKRYVAGTIVLDADAFETLQAARAGRRQQQAIVMHEFGHLLGLDHVEDSGELMNAQNLGRSSFGPGDRAGLALLGSGKCI